MNFHTTWERVYENHMVFQNFCEMANDAVIVVRDKKMHIFLKLSNKIRTLQIKSKVSRIGKNAHIFGKSFLVEPKTIEIGNDFRINEGVNIIGRKGCKIIIGDDVTLSSGTTILASGYDIGKWISEGVKEHITTTTTQIGNHVWVCANATILGG